MLPSLFHSGPSHHSARRVPPRGASRAAPARGAGLLALRDLALPPGLSSSVAAAANALGSSGSQRRSCHA